MFSCTGGWRCVVSAVSRQVQEEGVSLRNICFGFSDTRQSGPPLYMSVYNRLHECNMSLQETAHHWTSFFFFTDETVWTSLDFCSHCDIFYFLGDDITLWSCVIYWLILNVTQIWSLLNETVMPEWRRAPEETLQTRICVCLSQIESFRLFWDHFHVSFIHILNFKSLSCHQDPVVRPQTKCWITCVVNGSCGLRGASVDSVTCRQLLAVIGHSIQPTPTCRLTSWTIYHTENKPWPPQVHVTADMTDCVCVCVTSGTKSHTYHDYTDCSQETKDWCLTTHTSESRLDLGLVYLSVTQQSVFVPAGIRTFQFPTFKMVHQENKQIFNVTKTLVSLVQH